MTDWKTGWRRKAGAPPALAKNAGRRKAASEYKVRRTTTEVKYHMLFSHRKGLRPAEKPLQLEAVDGDLRNALWSCFYELHLKTFRGPERYPYGPQSVVPGSNLEGFFRSLWLSYFKIPTDEVPPSSDSAMAFLRKHFFEGKWHDVYDFMEFVLGAVEARTQEKLRKCWNSMLERENSGYRIVGTQIVEITNEVELSEIEQAVSSSTEGAQNHLRTAIVHFANKKKPDYRNSIKESISAVESICQAYTGDSGATLGVAVSFRPACVKSP